MEINPGKEKRNRSGNGTKEINLGREKIWKKGKINETGSARWHISIGHKFEIEARQYCNLICSTSNLNMVLIGRRSSPYLMLYPG